MSPGRVLVSVTLPVFEHYQEGGDSKWSPVSHFGCIAVRFWALILPVCLRQVTNSLAWPEEESSSPG
ncbi:hypothetical protein XENOCAPTIV_020266 [Xenoophorus captivus]|uniref:Uncharacterized protein n=1 Tax=Xenoophorus captivus TaxID=1517983 RepID=A0ABV0QES7_9TELE